MRLLTDRRLTCRVEPFRVNAELRLDRGFFNKSPAFFLSERNPVDAYPLIESEEATTRRRVRASPERSQVQGSVSDATPASGGSSQSQQRRVDLDTGVAKFPRSVRRRLRRPASWMVGIGLRFLRGLVRTGDMPAVVGFDRPGWGTYLGPSRIRGPRSRYPSPWQVGTHRADGMAAKRYRSLRRHAGTELPCARMPLLLFETRLNLWRPPVVRALTTVESELSPRLVGVDLDQRWYRYRPAAKGSR